MSNLDQVSVEDFVRDGIITVDGPFSEEVINKARELFNQGYYSKTAEHCDVEHPFLVNMLQNPFYEDVCKKLLSAKEVELCYTAGLRKPTYEEELTRNSIKAEDMRLENAHIDIKFSTSDIMSTPRKMSILAWLWLDDVDMNLSPFMYSPGSHLKIAETVKTAEDYATIGRYDVCPKLEYNEIQPALVKKGQISFLTTAMLHYGTANPNKHNQRKVLMCGYLPKGYQLKNCDGTHEKKRLAHLESLKEKFSSERRHVLPDGRPTIEYVGGV